MKKLVLAVSLLLGLQSVKAQDRPVHLIPRAGLSFTRQNVSGVAGDFKNKVGFQGGLALDIPVAKSIFSIQPEVNFVGKGFRFKQANTDLKKQLNYLEVPVLAKVAIGPLYLNAGPSIGLALASKNELQSIYGSNLNKIDFNLQMGGGLAVKAGAGKVVLDARYSLGLNDISQGATKAKNRAFMLSLGYAIPL